MTTVTIYATQTVTEAGCGYCAASCLPSMSSLQSVLLS
jgi:hypothetical protein